MSVSLYICFPTQKYFLTIYGVVKVSPSVLRLFSMKIHHAIASPDSAVITCSLGFEYRSVS